LIAAGRESIVLVDPASGKPVGPPLSVGGVVGGLAIDPTGRTLAVCTAAGTELIDLPVVAASEPGGPSTEVLTGSSLDPRGTLVPLTAADWTARRPSAANDSR
jgi:hypothetical protein